MFLSAICSYLKYCDKFALKIVYFPEKILKRLFPAGSLSDSYPL